MTIRPLLLDRLLLLKTSRGGISQSHVEMNCPDRLVSLQSHRVVPHHLSWQPLNPPPEHRGWKVTLSTVGARSCLARPLGDDHCPPTWAMSLMLVELTGEPMPKLVHHLMKAPETLQTLVLGWTPLPLGNQPTHIGAKSICSHHDVVWSVLTRMHAFGCVGQLRSQLEHRIARTSKLEKFLKIVLFAAELYAPSFRRPFGARRPFDGRVDVPLVPLLLPRRAPLANE